MEKNPAAVALGKLGGQSRSDAKVAASRANGARGGRPALKNHTPKAKMTNDEAYGISQMLDATTDRNGHPVRIGDTVQVPHLAKSGQVTDITDEGPILLKVIGCGLVANTDVEYIP